MPQSELVQALVRGLDLLRLTASRPDGMRLDELAAASGLKKTTAYNLLRTLCARDFLIRDARNRFRPGPAVFELIGTSRETGLTARAKAALQTLAAQFPQDVVTFSEFDGGAARCKLRISPDRPGELQQPVAMTFPPYVSVTALALQAAAPTEAQAFERQYPFAEYGAGVWGSAAALARAKAAALRDGFHARQYDDRFAIAFLLADGRVLGFSGAGPVAAAVAARRAAVAEFRRNVWTTE